MPRKPLLAALMAILWMFSTVSYSQDELTDDFLKIFIDCDRGCDHTYFKQEINYVNFMQNRQEADLFMQLTRQRTGTGGWEFTLRIVGPSAQDTIVFFTDPDATDNVIRNATLENIKKAMLPYLIDTFVGDLITYEVNLEEGEEQIVNTQIKDPWNYWVFRLRMNSWFNGQESSKFMNLFNSISVNRTTLENKFFISFNYSLNRSTFDLSDEETFTSKNENASSSFLYVYSIGDKWSAGFRGRISRSTFGNIELGAGIRPAIEYNFFPYTESSQHQFVIRYSLGPSYRNYEEVTVFDKLEEWLYEHSIDMEYTQIKNWGEVSIELEYENYLHDFSQLAIGLNPEISWNLAKGLSIRLNGLIAYISNLRNIQREEVDNNDILLQNRQLDTDFEYFGSVGISYRFGSSINNIVNPRF